RPIYDPDLLVDERVVKYYTSDLQETDPKPPVFVDPNDPFSAQLESASIGAGPSEGVPVEPPTPPVATSITITSFNQTNPTRCNVSSTDFTYLTDGDRLQINVTTGTLPDIDNKIHYI